MAPIFSPPVEISIQDYQPHTRKSRSLITTPYPDGISILIDFSYRFRPMPQNRCIDPDACARYQGHLFLGTGASTTQFL